MSHTGGLAFPRNILDHGHGVKTTHESGMTLRDYFAAKAMQGMLAHHGVLQNKKQAENDADGATRAYLIADAMLKARGA